MKDIELTPEELEFATKLWGLSEEEKKTLLPNLSGAQKRFINHWPKIFDYKMIAEVVWAKNCMRNAKPGDKMVFSAMGSWLVDESTFRCPWVAGAMLPMVYGMSDRIMDDLDPAYMGMDYMKCPDMEPEEGGLGSVLFKFHFIKEKRIMPEGAHRTGVDDVLKEDS